MQSAYRPNHSTETALVRVQSDILWALDKKKIVILVLLDLSAAFDTVRHSILLDRLEHNFGVTGNALAWFRSYLEGRTYCVSISGTQSQDVTLECGVPQGSVLGPVLFNIYTNQLGSLVRQHKMNYHGYADDSQLYASFSTDCTAHSVLQVELCLDAVRSWILTNNLMLNDNKTEIIVLGSKHRIQHTEPISVRIGESTIQPAHKVRNIGAIFDQHLAMTDHINSIARSSQYHLKRIGRIRRYLTDDAAASLVHAFVTSRLDYANALLGKVPDCHIKKLQKVQNTAARIVAKVPRREHIRPILHEMHWLPVSQRIQFKILLLCFKATTGLAPSYLAELVVPYTPTRSLRSADKHLLVVPRAQSTLGNRAFCCLAPVLWNELPQNMRSATSLDSFLSIN